MQVLVPCAEFKTTRYYRRQAHRTIALVHDNDDMYRKYIYKSETNRVITVYTEGISAQKLLKLLLQKR